MDPSAMAIQILFNSITLGSMLALASLGMNLSYGIMHIVNFAHGAIYMLGAYCVLVFYTRLGMPFFLALALAILVITLLAIPLYFLVYRFVYGQFLQSLIALLGLTMVIEGITHFAFGADDRTVPRFAQGLFTFLGASLSIERLVIMGVSLAGIAGLYLLVQRTKIGKAMRAVEQDRVTASLYGINVSRTCLVCLLLSFALAAMAGGLMVPLAFVNPYVGGNIIIIVFSIIIIGGLGSVSGCIVAAYLVGFAQSLAGTFLPMQFGHLITFSLMGLVLLIKPSGIMGHAIET